MPFSFYEHHEYLKVFNADLNAKDFLTEYDLSNDSIFFDLGAYDGNWSEKIYNKYQCNVYAFEPVNSFYEQSKDRLKNYPKVKVYNVGIGGSTRQEQITLNGAGSSVFTEGELKETIEIISMEEILSQLEIHEVDLIKINIEGAEYELLHHMINNSLQNKFKNIQIQFHANTNVKNYDEEIEYIREELSKTHKSTYCYNYIWENWERNG